MIEEINKALQVKSEAPLTEKQSTDLNQLLRDDKGILVGYTDSLTLKFVELRDGNGNFIILESDLTLVRDRDYNQDADFSSFMEVKPNVMEALGTLLSSSTAENVEVGLLNGERPFMLLSSDDNKKYLLFGDSNYVEELEDSIDLEHHDIVIHKTALEGFCAFGEMVEKTK